MSAGRDQYDEHPSVAEAEQIVASAYEYHTNREAIRAVAFMGGIAIGVGYLFMHGREELLDSTGWLFTFVGTAAVVGSAMASLYNRIKHEQRIIDAETR